jgi:choline transport protein
MPLLARIIAYLYGKKHRLEGPYSLGRFGLPLNIIGFLFLTFCSITFNFPTLNPVDSENMNYTSAAIGVVMFVSAITWFTTGRTRFTGPDSGHLLDAGRREEVAATEPKSA